MLAELFQLGGSLTLKVYKISHCNNVVRVYINSNMTCIWTYPLNAFKETFLGIRFEEEGGLYGGFDPGILIF